MPGNWFSSAVAVPIVAGVAAFGPLTASPDPAALVQANDPAFGAGLDGFNLTRDARTGFEWLDLTLTAGLSYDDVAGGARGFLAAGFSIANTDQVATMFMNFGARAVDGTLLASQFTSASNLISALGCTSPMCASPGFATSRGWADMVPSLPGIVASPLVEAGTFQGTPRGRFWTGGVVPTTLKSEFAGTYLLRPFAVPEPSIPASAPWPGGAGMH